MIAHAAPSRAWSELPAADRDNIRRALRWPESSLSLYHYRHDGPGAWTAHTPHAERGIRTEEAHAGD